MLNLHEKYAAYVVPSYGRFDLDIVRGRGCRVWDASDRSYLDFGAGIAVTSLGHCYPAVTEAICRQAETLIHTSNLYYTLPQAALAEALVNALGIAGKVFFCNSGAEANEGLYKLARKFGSETGRYEILTFEGSFHGRTLAGISATGQNKVRKGFEPLVEGFKQVPFNDLEAVEKAIGPQTVAILLEPIQGEGGIHPATREFLIGLRQLCDQHQLLLLFDEIQSGLGRTGHWSAAQAIAGSDFIPDGISWAKGLGNGIPIGAFWVRQTEANPPLCDILGPGAHGSTFGGNPVACAAGVEVVKTIQQNALEENAVKVGAYLNEALTQLSSPYIKEIRSFGLMIGLELAPEVRELFPDEDQNKSISILFTTALMRQGMLVIPAGDRVLRLLPPLNITLDEAKEAVQIFHKVLSSTPQNTCRATPAA